MGEREGGRERNGEAQGVERKVRNAGLAEGERRAGSPINSRQGRQVGVWQQEWTGRGQNTASLNRHPNSASQGRTRKPGAAAGRAEKRRAATAMARQWKAQRRRPSRDGWGGGQASVAAAGRASKGGQAGRERGRKGTKWTKKDHGTKATAACEGGELGEQTRATRSSSSERRVRPRADAGDARLAVVGDVLVCGRGDEKAREDGGAR